MENIISFLNSDNKWQNTACLESPHGTGKTLSLLCSILFLNKKTFQENNIRQKRIIYCTKKISEIYDIMEELDKIKNIYDIKDYCFLCFRENFCDMLNN